MKVKTSPVKIGTKSQIPVTPKIPSRDFKEVLQGTPKTDLFTEIQNIQKSILSGKEFSGKDLILYQIKTSQFGLRVELVSKVAEAAVTTIKKFQNPQ